MNIFYVSNPKGVQQYITTDLAALDAALLAAVQDLRCTPLATLQKFTNLESGPASAVHPPKEYQRLLKSPRMELISLEWRDNEDEVLVDALSFPPLTPARYQRKRKSSRMGARRGWSILKGSEQEFTMQLLLSAHG